MTKVTFIIGTIGGFITALFGGWSIALKILIIFMLVDYITGILNAAVFKTSGKSATGTLSSAAGFKGLCRKGTTLLIVMVACQLDILMGSTIIRDITIITFILNELVSIIENAGLMGIPIPKIIRNAIELLRSKTGEAAPQEQEELTDDTSLQS